jgi:methyltransferase, FkbM family
LRIANFLSKNIKLNKKNISVIPYIVGNKIGNASIENRKADDMNQVIEEGKQKMITLDKICSSLEKIHLLKIDVEGYELFVLEGGIRTLKKTEKIFIEVIDELLNKYSKSSNDLFSFLNKNGFTLFDEIDNKNFIFKKK